jgi:ferric-dicitrate binding protein FerR (iron transport regulator)
VSDYLWNREGEPDPELEHLERVLAPLAYRGQLPLLPRRRTMARARVWWLSGGVVAAAALLALLPWRRPHPPTWAATVEGGVASCDGRSLSGETKIPLGAWLETASSRTTLKVADIGSVELGPGSRARIVETGAEGHKLELARGTLLAKIDAPPRHFLVQTPTVLLIDLGCAFELTVDEKGRGRLTVTAGAVALSDGARHEVKVPAGAECDFDQHGVGTPQIPHDHQPSEPPVTPQPNAPSEHLRPNQVPKHSKAAAPITKTTKSTPTQTPTQKQPAQKADTSLKLHHDSLEDLERSAP